MSLLVTGFWFAAITATYWGCFPGGIQEAVMPCQLDWASWVPLHWVAFNNSSLTKELPDKRRQTFFFFFDTYCITLPWTTELVLNSIVHPPLCQCFKDSVFALVFTCKHWRHWHRNVGSKVLENLFFWRISTVKVSCVAVQLWNSAESPQKQGVACHSSGPNISLQPRILTALSLRAGTQLLLNLFKRWGAYRCKTYLAPLFKKESLSQ